MDQVVVDTDVVSFYLKEDTRFASYAPHLHGKRLIMSFMTYAELLYWQDIRNWGKKRRDAFENDILSNYVLYPADRQLCKTWSSIRSNARSQGRGVETADAWIAATAMVLGVPLVSHNKKDFEHISGLELLSLSEH